jgi:hypothetical protein
MLFSIIDSVTNDVSHKLNIYTKSFLTFTLLYTMYCSIIEFEIEFSQSTFVTSDGGGGGGGGGGISICTDNHLCDGLKKSKWHIFTQKK